MRVYLAGGITGNLNPFWKIVCGLLGKLAYQKALEEAMRLFLAGGNGRRFVLDELFDTPQKEGADMKIFLAGDNGMHGILEKDQKDIKLIAEHGPYILESFYYADEDTERLIPFFGDFLLDSGAFTFMQGSHGKPIVWDEYVEKYAAFIVKNDVKKFFELDIDPIVGYPEVLRLRKKLESLAGRPSIPVWHKTRGKDEFLKMCDQYKYVAIGGVVTKEIKQSEYRFFPYFISEAHKRGCKIHGLGFTNLQGMRKYHFDSVDSTTWTVGNRYGKIYRFNGHTMEHYDRPAGSRLINSREAAKINFIEWLKFQRYAEEHL